MGLINWIFGVKALTKILQLAPFLGQPLELTKRGLRVKLRRRL